MSNLQFQKLEKVESLNLLINRKQQIVNALSFTSSVTSAARELGISSNTLKKYMIEVEITLEDVDKLRFIFKNEPVKIKTNGKQQK